MPLCGHVFHSDCADEWLTHQAFCPLCKSKVKVCDGVLISVEPERQKPQVDARRAAYELTAIGGDDDDDDYDSESH